MAKIETLEIEITASANNAQNSIEKLTKALSGLTKTVNLEPLVNKFTILGQEAHYTRVSVDGLISSLEKLAGMATTMPKIQMQAAPAPAVQTPATERSRMDFMQLEVLIARLNGTVDRLNESLSQTGKRTRTIGESAKKATTPVSQLLAKLKGIFFMRGLRLIVNKVFASIGEGFKDAYFYMKQLNTELGIAVSGRLDKMATAFETFKNQLGAVLIQIVYALEPALEAIMRVVTYILDVITQWVSALTGFSTYLKASDIVKDMFENTEKGAKSAKEWKNALMGFDELNVLPDSSGSSSGKTTDYGGMFAGDSKINGTILDIGGWINKNFAAIMMLGGAALFTVGAILAFSGTNIPIGCKLMAAGAVSLYASTKVSWDAMSSTMKSAIGILGLVLSGALFTIGAVLAFSGVNIPLGIGLMAAGIVTGGTTALNWHNIADSISDSLAAVMLVTAGASMAIGLILMLSGVNIPLGLGLLATGALTMAAVSKTPFWEKIPGLITETLNEVTNVFSRWWKAISEWWSNLRLGSIIFGGGVNEYGDYVPGFASGGFPTTGQLFLANEAGPEMVGSIDGHSAVANNQQIVEAVSQGVYKAVSSALGGNGNSVGAVYLDGRELYNSMVRYERGAARAYGR